MIERMFDYSGSAQIAAVQINDAQMVDAQMVDAQMVEAWIEQLAGSHGADDDEGRIRMIRALERLVCAAHGLQAEITARFDESVRRGEAELGQRPERCGKGVAMEVALARRESHHRGRQHVGLARILVDEMPCTFRALRAGLVSPPCRRAHGVVLLVCPPSGRP
jgi:hypothetical protein